MLHFMQFTRAKLPKHTKVKTCGGGAVSLGTMWTMVGGGACPGGGSCAWEGCWDPEHTIITSCRIITITRLTFYTVVIDDNGLRLKAPYGSERMVFISRHLVDLKGWSSSQGTLWIWKDGLHLKARCGSERMVFVTRHLVDLKGLSSSQGTLWIWKDCLRLKAPYGSKRTVFISRHLVDLKGLSSTQSTL